MLAGRTRDELLAAAAAARELKRRRTERLCDYIRPLPLQHAFLSDPALKKMMRAGNKLQGKTYAGFLEGIYHARGRHPYYDVPPPPSVGAIAFPSTGSYVKESGKLWELLPKDEIDTDATEYIEGKGFRGRYPHIRWRNGSITWIVWVGSGGLNLAGPGYDWLHLNEPPPNSRIYQELMNRLLRGNPGRAWLTMTPVNAPTDYIQELVERGVIADHHRELTADAMIPVGSTRPVRLPNGELCDEAWVQRKIADTLPHEVPVVVHGHYDFRVEGNVFRAFKRDGPGAHVTAELPKGDVDLQAGGDHGKGANFSNTALLVAVRRHPVKRAWWQIWVLDEYVPNKDTTEDEDAAGWVAMLARLGQPWQELARAYGDRAWEGKSGLIRKDNERLAAAIERHLELRPGTLDPPIDTVKRGKNRGRSKSVDFGMAFLHRAMVRPDCFHVHPRCKHLIKALGRWEGKDDEWKHILDALRYALDEQIFAFAEEANVPEVYVY